jgi:hypothetical protein
MTMFAKHPDHGDALIDEHQVEEFEAAGWKVDRKSEKAAEKHLAQSRAEVEAKAAAERARGR